jgi:hypothetical protein
MDNFYFEQEEEIQRCASAAARDQHQLAGTRLLEKHAIAPSAARLCWAAASG